jgi:hypothetical protein
MNTLILENTFILLTIVDGNANDSQLGTSVAAGSSATKTHAMALLDGNPSSAPH